MAATDPRVAGARREVIAARGDLCDELDRLEASARAAVDVRAQLRRHPEKAAAVAGVVGFLALGGPRRLLRFVRRLLFGRPAKLPERMLPEEIEAAVERLGEDGDKVRGTLEREFAAYLEEKRRNGTGSGWRDALFASVVVPAASAGLREAVRRYLSGEPIGPTAGRGAAGTAADAAGDGRPTASRGGGRGGRGSRGDAAPPTRG
ncbi:MAG: hypothetical protein RL338_1904 [Chloroflexota bacterium]|jgi:hypothetical protein